MQQPGAQVVRVKATKGFYATVAGQFGIVNPGDVVPLDRYTASLVVGAGKARAATADEKETRQASYLPERKRSPKKTTEDLLATLVEAVAANTQAIHAWVAKSAESPPKK